MHRSSRGRCLTRQVSTRASPSPTKRSRSSATLAPSLPGWVPAASTKTEFLQQGKLSRICCNVMPRTISSSSCLHSISRGPSINVSAKFCTIYSPLLGQIPPSLSESVWWTSIMHGWALKRTSGCVNSRHAARESQDKSCTGCARLPYALCRAPTTKEAIALM